MVMNKFIGLLLLVFTIVVYSCQSEHEQTSFKVKDGRLFDARNNEFVIRGMNMPHAWFTNSSFKALDELTKYNVNCVRIVWEVGLQVAELEKVVEHCVDLQMIPMIELHNATGDSTDTKLLEMVQYYTSDEMKALVKKYESYILLNIANEWGDHSMSDEYWRDAYNKAVRIMRNAGYKTTIVIDAPGWGQNVTPILNYGQQLLDEDPMHNLLFSIHMYGSWNDEGKIKSTLTQVKEMKIPLVIGEFGYNFHDGDNNLSCTVNHQVILKECEKLHIGYIPWSWTGNNDENRWLDIVSRDDWKSLTKWGREVLMSDYGIKNTGKKASVFR